MWSLSINIQRQLIWRATTASKKDFGNIFGTSVKTDRVFILWTDSWCITMRMWNSFPAVLFSCYWYRKHSGFQLLGKYGGNLCSNSTRIFLDLMNKLQDLFIPSSRSDTYQRGWDPNGHFSVKNFHNQFLGRRDALEGFLYLENKRVSTSPSFCLGNDFG